MSEHINYLDVVNQMAAADWGMNSESELMQKDLIKNPGLLQAFASLELLKRLKAIAAAAGPVFQKKAESTVLSFGTPKLFPQISVGARLYEFSAFDMSLQEFLVVSRAEDGKCICAPCYDFDLTQNPKFRLADDDFYETTQEAVSTQIDAALEDNRETSAKWELARKAAEAGVEALSEFLDSLE